MPSPSKSEMSNGQLLLTAVQQLNVPAERISPQNVLTLLASAVEQIPPESKGSTLFTATLDNKQWESLNKVNRELAKDYALRSELMLKRLDVTIDSFTWSEKGAQMKDDVMKTYEEARNKIQHNGDVELSDLIAATTDLLIVDKASSSAIRANTQNPLTKYLMKENPADRGGRTTEIAAPEPEVPSWRKGGRGGGRGGHRGQQRGGHGKGDYRRNNFEDQVKDQIRHADRRAHAYTEFGGPNVGPSGSAEDSRRSKRGRHC